MNKIYRTLITATAGMTIVAGLALVASTASAQVGTYVGASAAATVGSDAVVPTNTSAAVNTSANTSVNGSASDTGSIAARRAGRTASTTAANFNARMQAAHTEITNRINTLNALTVRLQAMKFVSASEKTTLQTQIQTEITALTNFQATLGTATSSASVKTGTKTTIDATRIYALIVPQSTILAAADRIENIASEMTTVTAKLQTRVAATSTLATSATLQADLTDLATQISNAEAQASAAHTEVVTLTADQGVQAQLTANTTALKDAHTKLQAAAKDITAARADITAVIKGLGISASASASTSVQ